MPGAGDRLGCSIWERARESWGHCWLGRGCMSSASIRAASGSPIGSAPCLNPDGRARWPCGWPMCVSHPRGLSIWWWPTRPTCLLAPARPRLTHGAQRPAPHALAPDPADLCCLGQRARIRRAARFAFVLPASERASASSQSLGSSRSSRRIAPLSAAQATCSTPQHPRSERAARRRREVDRERILERIAEEMGKMPQWTQDAHARQLSEASAGSVVIDWRGVARGACEHCRECMCFVKTNAFGPRAPPLARALATYCGRCGCPDVSHHAKG